MEQLILHLLGDYITQTNKMALEKTKSSAMSLLHAVVYSLPFLLIASPTAVFVIFSTHNLIDRARLARYVVFLKNWIHEPSLTWAECRENNGYPKGTPAHISFWLLIIVDNTMHLICNYLAIRYY